MARMLGRMQVPGCCPGTRAGRDPGPDCSGGGSMGARAAKRVEHRALIPEMTAHLQREIFEPLIDLSDCQHGCNGSPCGSDRCTFVCHEAANG